MNRIEIPESLRTAQDELHRRLVAATREPGALGEAARELARLVHLHFEREEKFALPPLGLLAPLARGVCNVEMAQVVRMARRLKEELPALVAEHHAIAEALGPLRGAAAAAGRHEYERLADALLLQAQTEEQVLYPAAIMVGEYMAHVLRPQALGAAL